MRSYSVVFVAVVLLPACASWRHVPPTYDRDSVHVEIVRREEVVRDTVRIEILAQSESKVVSDSSFLSNDYALSEARILSSGELYHTLETIAQQIEEPVETIVEIRDSVIYRQRDVSHIIERERELTAWQRFQIKTFYYLVAIFVTFIVCKFM